MQRMNITEKLWSEMEKHRLLYFTSHNTKHDLVDWKNYKDDVPGKSMQQAKSYYNNILKRKKEKRFKYFTEDEVMEIIYLSVVE